MTPDPESLFAELVARTDQPRADDVEALCRAHPDLRNSIELMFQDWLEFDRLASQVVPIPPQGAKGGDRGDIAAAVQSRAYPQSVLDALLDRLLRRRQPNDGLRRVSELARGGMGVIDVARDDVLRRTIAIKSVRDEIMQESDEDYRSLLTGRLIEEAQITAQLDHPAIVPVHELSVDDEGEPWFSMKLVRGQTLAELLARRNTEERTTALPSTLGILIKVSQALAYAHDKGVVHRDVKPANIMVGRYGEVYLMDWGLAHLVQDDECVPSTNQDSARGVHLSYLRDNDEYLETGFDGAIVGTPAYMSPEQADGAIQQISKSTDLYAAGAVLYRVLTGIAPYADVVPDGSPFEVVERLRAGPPTPIERVAPGSNRELVAICEKAMAREPSQRYASVAEFAEDLSSFQEGRVVVALESGLRATVRKWIGRNKSLAAAAAVGLLGIGFAVSLVLAGGGEFEGNTRLRFAAAKRLHRLQSRADELWPPSPDKIRDMEAWLRDSNDLAAELWPQGDDGSDGHVAALRLLREQALPVDPDLVKKHREAHRLAGELDAARALSRASGRDSAELDVRRLETLIDLGLPFEFADDETTWWHARHVELVQGLLELSGNDASLVEGGGPSVAERLRLARGFEEAMEVGSEWRERWDEAIEAIRRHPAYGGLNLTAQVGLVPLEPDPKTGLWEFAHELSGTAPARNRVGQLHIVSESGIVLVLIPGGDALLGAQSDADSIPNFDDLAEAELEAPPVEVAVEPFFLSKYEFTQSQWLRWPGTNPSGMPAAMPVNVNPLTLVHPVEKVAFARCAETCRWLGLRLPTEEEWEYAARSGSAAAYVSGKGAPSLEGWANVADASLRRGLPSPDWGHASFDDGWVRTSPVGSFRPNGFGLHDVSGNVWEWCQPLGRLPGRVELAPGMEILRGGSWLRPPEDARLAHRRRVERGFMSDEAGFRPARSIQ